MLMEHGKFFVMLMPGAELAAQRGRAEQFQDVLRQPIRKAQSASLDSSNYAAFNRSTVELVKPFIDFKHGMKEAQEAGKLKSLVWPLFFEHTAREGERFTRRLEQILARRGRAGSGRGRRLLDGGSWASTPTSSRTCSTRRRIALVQKAMQTSTAFREPARRRSLTSKDAVEKAANDIIDFKTAAEKGIQTGKIKSIIHPALADHVRREAVKFADELKRAA